MIAEAARLTDSIGHTNALVGLLVGAVLGIATAVAIVAIVGTGGMAAVCVGAGIAAAGASGGLSGAYIGELIQTSPTGTIRSGAQSVIICAKPAACAVLDTTECSGVFFADTPAPPIAEGSSTVFITGMPAARKGEKITCGATIRSGAETVLIGGEPLRLLPVDPDIPVWLENGLWVTMWVGTIIATGGVAAAFGWGAAIGGLGGGIAGSLGLGWVGGQIGESIGQFFGNAELGARIGEVTGATAGGIVGGILGAKFGSRFGPAAEYPSQNKSSIEAWERVNAAMDEAGIGGRKMITVRVLENGDVIYGVSGSPAKQAAMYSQIEEILPANYRSGQTDTSLQGLLPGRNADGSIQPGRTTCSEVSAYAGTGQERTTSLSTGWRGTQTYPAPPNAHISPLGDQWAAPCGSCARNANTIMELGTPLPPILGGIFPGDE